jgi:hypothetical protein
MKNPNENNRWENDDSSFLVMPVHQAPSIIGFFDVELCVQWWRTKVFARFGLGLSIALGLSILCSDVAMAAELPATPSTLASVFSAAQGGDIILLASGNYGTFTGGVKTGRVTFRLQPGATVTLYAEFNPASNLTFDGVPMAGLQVKGASRNLVFSNVLFTAQVTFRDATGPMSVLFDHCTWGAIDSVGYYEGRLSVVGGGVTGPCGIVVQNSKFGPGGNLDGIQTGGDGLQILNNEFVGIRSGGSGIHTDAIQLYGTGERNTVIRGNYIHDCDSGIMAVNGTDHELIEHNVIDPGDYPYAIQLGGDKSSIICHNTLPDGPAQWGMRTGIIFIRADPLNHVSTGTVVENNILSAVIVEAGSSASVNYNLIANAAPIGPQDINGLPTYVGGAPTNYAGYTLAAGSLGRGNASDGTDRGIMASTNPPPIRTEAFITSPANGVMFASPALITLAAEATAFSNGVTKVEFFSGTTKLGEDTTAPYSYTWSNVPIGTYTLTAKVTDGSGISATSAPVNITVSAPATVVVGSSSEGTTTDTITDTSGAYINACRFQAQTSQSVTMMRAKVGAITGRYKCAIYSDVGGNASQLLRATSALTNVAAGWQTFPLTAPLSLTNGTYYWLALWSDDVNARVSADPGGTLRYAAYPFGNWPTTVNFTGSGPLNYSLYATGPSSSAFLEFQQWKSNYGLAAATAPSNDDDHDGVPLLLEYALGLDPLTGSSTGLPNGSLQGDFLTLTYKKIKAATDITCTAEVSSNLVNWLNTTSNVEQRWQVTDEITSETITARDKTPVPSATSRFMRLKVTQP